MQLNLPIFEQLSSCQNLLIAGMGGGFDVFCGLPIYFELQRRGQKPHLASFSFSDIIELKDAQRLSKTLVGVTADCKAWLPYFPERHLAQWFREKRSEEVIVWCFQKTGAYPLTDNYRALIEHLSLDGILLIDGGVDSLMRGDETQLGTAVEDATSLLAVSELTDVPIRLIACVGFGAEEDIAYAHVLENIAALAQTGGFLGACALTREMEAYQMYEDAVLNVHDQPLQDASVINASIISAVQGHFGNYHLTKKTKGSRLWISPLMALYWFFDLQAVVERNLFLSQFQGTETFRDALFRLMEVRKVIPKRPPANILLP